MNPKKLAVLYLAVCSLFTVFFYAEYRHQRNTLRDVAEIDAKLRSYVVREVITSTLERGPLGEEVLFALVESTNVDYIILLKDDSVLQWASKYEGFLPVADYGSVEPGIVREIESPLYPIVEFSFLADSLKVVCGYSMGLYKHLLNSIIFSMLLVLGVLLAVFGVSIFSVYLMEKRMKEQEINVLREKEQVKYFRELAGLSAQVAHEVKNSINSMSIAAQMLERGNIRPDFLEAIKEGIGRLNSVTEKFNELGKTLQVKREEISLQSLFMEIEKEFEGILVGSGIQLKTELGIDRIRTDVILLKQAISNIIKNSIEAFDGVSKEAKVIEIRVREEKKRVYFEIEDNGRGMDADEVTRAFEYFFTTKPSGMGIGLSMVKRIVEALGGEIRIESTKGIGTKAEFFVGNE